MRTVQDRWAGGRIVSAVYDVAVQHRVTAWLGARALWGFDVAVLHDEIQRLGALPPGTALLDVPTGGGLAFGGLWPGHGIDYVAADLSPVMLARARARAERLRLDGLELVAADAAALPFPDDRFDVVLSLTGLHCFPDPEAALREFRRVLRPTGELRLTTVVRGAGRRHDDAIRLLCGLGIFGRVGTPEALGAWLRAAGFTRIDQRQEGALAVVTAA